MEQTNAAKIRGKCFPEQNIFESSLAKRKVNSRLNTNHEIFAACQFIRAKGVKMA
jgi:hypothetical protein